VSADTGDMGNEISINRRRWLLRRREKTSFERGAANPRIRLAGDESRRATASQWA